MIEQVPVGTWYSHSFLVTESVTVGAHGTVDLPVLATPHLIFMLEDACVMAVASFLQEHQVSVGAAVYVNHLAPAYVGDEIDVIVELVSVRGRRLVFRVQACRGAAPVGQGLHERVIIDKENFEVRAPSGQKGAGR
ncbi:Fluoroacetyl-CoA thioesterase [Castellaniella defragrans]